VNREELPPISGAAQEISPVIDARTIGRCERRISSACRQKKGGRGKEERHCCGD
jgi:hypothetical protein